MTIWRWLKRWLNEDRIRISPQAGEILRLEVGQRVIMNDLLWVIVERDVRKDDTSVGVRYHLVEQDAEGHPVGLMTPPILGDRDDWLQSKRERDSVWMDCFCENV